MDGLAAVQIEHLSAFKLVAVLLLAADPKSQPHWPMFRKHLINEGANESAAVADVNKDGRLDIIAGENWYEAPDWKKHRMREIPFIEGYIDDLSNFAPALAIASCRHETQYSRLFRS